MKSVPNVQRAMREGKAGRRKIAARVQQQSRGSVGTQLTKMVRRGLGK